MTWPYIQGPKESTKKLFELISPAMLKDTRAMYRNQMYFYALEVSNPKKKLRKQFHLQ